MNTPDTHTLIAIKDILNMFDNPAFAAKMRVTLDIVQEYQTAIAEANMYRAIAEEVLGLEETERRVAKMTRCANFE
jgi:hypothetical protein